MEGLTVVDWTRVRENRFSPDPPPSDWTPGVRPLSQEGLSLFGINPDTDELYWDGKRVVVERRFKLEGFERVLAILVSLSAITVAVVEVARFLGFGK